MNEAYTDTIDFPSKLKGRPVQKKVYAALADEGGEMKRSEIANETGVGPDSVSQALRGLRSDDLVKKVGHGFYDLADVGATPAQGNLEDDTTQSLALGAESTPEDNLASLFSQDTVMTIHTEAKVAAGNGRVVYPDEATHEVSVPKHFLARLLGFHPPSTIGVMEAEGDSMKPTIRDGDLIIYEPVQEIRSAGIYVLHLRTGATVKRVQPLADGSYRIIPDNAHRGYSRMTLIPNDGDGFRLEETGRSASMYPVGKVRFPDRSTDEIHIQQVGEIIRSVVRGDGVEMSRWEN